MTAISFEKAQACIRLIAECNELWDDPRSWQEHLTDSIERIVGGYGSLVSINTLEPGCPTTIDAHSALSNGPEIRIVFDQFIEAGGIGLMPSANAVLEALPRHGQFTWNERALIGSRKFKKSTLYQRHLRKLDAESVLFHSAVLPDRAVLSVGLLRNRNDQEYTQNDEHLMALIGNAVAKGLNSGWCLSDGRGRHLLTEREKETLECFLAGLSEKEIALELNLSVRTIHDYVTSIYRKLGFNSRAGLMSAYIKRGF